MAGSHNFIVYKGETWTATISATLNGSAVDFTGYTIEMDVRTSPGNSAELLTLTTSNSRAAIDGSGNIVLSLSAVETAALTFDGGVYDLKTTTGSTVNYLLKGSFLIEKSVTR